MLELYRRWNILASKLLVWLVAAGLVAGLPLAYERLITEQSSDQVEMVFDYRDLIDISDFKANPAAFIDEQLSKLEELGVGSMAVYESSLNELKLSRRVQLLSSREAAVLTGRALAPNENFTYLVFTDPAAQQSLQPMIERSFRAFDVAIEPWAYQGRNGLIIEMPLDDALLRPLDPDPLTLRYLREKGFQIVVRLSDNRPFIPEHMEALLAEMKGLGVTRIIFSGDSVTGFNDDEDTNSLTAMAQFMNDNGIGLVTIELQRKEQKGLKKLAYLTGYNVVRLHPLPDREAFSSKSKISDRLVLAVKDRNIRMIFLNAAASRSVDKGVTDPLDNLYEGLEGPDGAIQRIQSLGYDIGTAQPFAAPHSNWQKPLKAFVLLGGVALIALTFGLYAPSLVMALFALVAVGTAGLYAVSSNLMLQAMALGVGICAPTLAVIMAIRAVKSGKSGEGQALRFSINLFIKTTLISLAGALYVVALLNPITYSLMLEQFRGVGLLHLLPIVLVTLYLAFFADGFSLAGTVRKVRSLLWMNIKVIWVLALGAAGIAIVYYLSRTGNEGAVSPYERIFRTVLENTLGVRPRTKEFLFAHPLFIVGAYYAIKYRHAVYLFIIGVIGQLSVIDTFAHLHTPLDISFIRVTYGALLGIVVGLIYIGLTGLVLRGWNRWARI
jgi:hypothetical protein